MVSGRYLEMCSTTGDEITKQLAKLAARIILFPTKCRHSQRILSVHTSGTQILRSQHDGPHRSSVQGETEQRAGRARPVAPSGNTGNHRHPVYLRPRLSATERKREMIGSSAICWEGARMALRAQEAIPTTATLTRQPVTARIEECEPPRRRARWRARSALRALHERLVGDCCDGLRGPCADDGICLIIDLGPSTVALHSASSEGVGRVDGARASSCGALFRGAPPTRGAGSALSGASCSGLPRPQLRRGPRARSALEGTARARSGGEQRRHTRHSPSFAKRRRRPPPAVSSSQAG